VARRGPEEEGDVSVLRWAVPALIALFAFAIRILPFRDVFVGGRVFFIDSDCYYHMRRIEYAMMRFPEALGFDFYLNYPDGGKAIWPPLLDWLIAGVLLPFADAANRIEIQSLVVWIPPVVGAATVAAVHGLARRHFDPHTAWPAALILSILPAHFWYSQISFVDHHAFVSLVSVLLVGATMALLAQLEAQPTRRRETATLGATVGALAGLSLLIWPGSILYVMLSELAIGAYALSRRSADRAHRALVAGIWFNVVSLVMLLPFSWFNVWRHWSAFSAVVLSRFQIWLFLALIVLFGSSLVVWRLRSCESRGMRTAWLAFIGVVLLCASLLAFAGLPASLVDSWAWLGRTDAFQAMVAESLPLFVLRGEWTTAVATLRLSYFIYLFPVCIALMAWREYRDAARAEIFFLIAWSLVLFVFTLIQKRFFNTFSIALAMTAGWACRQAYLWLAARAMGGRAGRARAVSATFIVALLIISPAFAAYRGPLTAIGRNVLGRPTEPTGRTVVALARSEMTDWLRIHTPTTAGYFDATIEPEYGVLARWGEGHFISFEARRPATIGNFGDDLGRDHFLLARSFFEASPERAPEILESLGVRYIVIRARLENRAMAKRLFFGDGTLLGRYRLVHEVGPLPGSHVPAYKIFEFVEGAELVGRAPVGATIRASLLLTTNLGRELEYKMQARTGEDGLYRLRLPHATRGHPPSLTPQGAYRISLLDVEVEVGAEVGVEVDVEVDLEERDVQRGSRIPGPDF